MCVCLSAAAFLHYCTDPDGTWRNGRGALVVYYWADWQSAHGFRCYDKPEREMSASACTRSIPGYCFTVQSFQDSLRLSPIFDSHRRRRNSTVSSRRRCECGITQHHQQQPRRHSGHDDSRRSDVTYSINSCRPLVRLLEAQVSENLLFAETFAETSF